MNCHARLIAIVSELSHRIHVARDLASNSRQLAHYLLSNTNTKQLTAVYCRAPPVILKAQPCQRPFHTTTHSALFCHKAPTLTPRQSRKTALESVKPPDWYFRPMNHFDVIRALVPIIQKELGTTNALGLYASLQAMSRWQSSNRSASRLPGVPAMTNDKLDYELINATYHILRYATATYGWKGMTGFGAVRTEVFPNVSAPCRHAFLLHD
jgi:hypothetical protein